ncbi:MAG TPA: hypothetical protein VE954_36850 [Oligoflexus sp.]|uniref:hypothetical protein n=1 Tax=Oligoflexus sp. TaxID=1971216 RepID=UPI002D2D5A08|nr:hypothetical protein [Oligoflexus sp.]HYX38707.1 hypothetical protein [Oligoflexus sp.]
MEKGDRRVFLEKECSNDKAVQMEVESLFLTPDEIEPRLKAQTAKSIVVMHSVMSRFH